MSSSSSLFKAKILVPISVQMSFANETSTASRHSHLLCNEHAVSFHKALDWNVRWPLMEIPGPYKRCCKSWRDSWRLLLLCCLPSLIRICLRIAHDPRRLWTLPCERKMTTHVTTWRHQSFAFPHGKVMDSMCSSDPSKWNTERVDECCFNKFTRRVRRAEGYPLLPLNVIQTKLQVTAKLKSSLFAISHIAMNAMRVASPRF